MTGFDTLATKADTTALKADITALKWIASIQGAISLAPSLPSWRNSHGPRGTSMPTGMLTV